METAKTSKLCDKCLTEGERVYLAHVRYDRTTEGKLWQVLECERCKDKSEHARIETSHMCAHCSGVMGEPVHLLHKAQHGNELELECTMCDNKPIVGAAVLDGLLL